MLFGKTERKKLRRMTDRKNKRRTERATLGYLTFLFLVVENEVIPCVLERQRKRKKETRQRLKESNKNKREKRRE